MAFSDSTWQVHLPQWTQLFSFSHVGTKKNKINILITLLECLLDNLTWYFILSHTIKRNIKIRRHTFSKNKIINSINCRGLINRLIYKQDFKNKSRVTFSLFSAKIQINIHVNGNQIVVCQPAHLTTLRTVVFLTILSFYH